jgi:hypothetical protein
LSFNSGSSGIFGNHFGCHWIWDWNSVQRCFQELQVWDVIIICVTWASSYSCDCCQQSRLMYPPPLARYFAKCLTNAQSRNSANNAAVLVCYYYSHFIDNKLKQRGEITVQDHSAHKQWARKIGFKNYAISPNVLPFKKSPECCSYLCYNYRVYASFFLSLVTLYLLLSVSVPFFSPQIFSSVLSLEPLAEMSILHLHNCCKFVLWKCTLFF